MFSKLERLMLSSEMEVLRGPLLFALCLAALMHLWGRQRYTGLFPKDLESWRELASRSSAAVAVSYSAMGLLRYAPNVSLIAFFFAILTLCWSCFQRSDRGFFRWWGWVALALSLLAGILRPTIVE